MATRIFCCLHSAARMRLLFWVEAMSDKYHKALYDRVRADHPGIPAWEDLTDEQKARMRLVNDKYTRFMNNLGNEIRDKEVG